MDQYDKYVDRALSDLMLMDLYLKKVACKNIMSILESTSEELEITDERKKRTFMKRMIPLVIPPGVKASVRGAALNTYIKNLLTRETKGLGWELAFEARNCKQHVTEIPDWTLKIGDKLIIGFNQLDLWKGGAQINRAAKYILDDDIHERLHAKGIVLVCVVARKPPACRDTKCKLYNILEKGIATQRLLWPRGLKKYLKQYS